MTDAGAPEHWLDEHGDALYRYALLRVRDNHVAEELVQETLLAALQARKRYAGDSTVRTWLIGILKHKIMDQFRREAREAPLDEVSAGEREEQADAPGFLADGHWRTATSDWGDPLRLMESSQFWSILQYCLDLLPKRLARLFVLREIMEEDTDEICKDQAITPTNLWTMLYRARLGLRQCLERNWVG